MAHDASEDGLGLAERCYTRFCHFAVLGAINDEASLG